MIRIAVFILVSIIPFSVPLRAQPGMSEKERHIRSEADISAFLESVKQTPDTLCLCNSDEYTVLSFRTEKRKIVSLCVSRNLSDLSGYMVYRFGTKNSIELELPKDRINSFSFFCMDSYFRGGGAGNEGLDLNRLSFFVHPFTYSLYDETAYRLDEETGRELPVQSFGIRVKNKNSKVEYDIKGSDHADGSLTGLQLNRILPLSDQDNCDSFPEDLDH